MLNNKTRDASRTIRFIVFGMLMILAMLLAILIMQLYLWLYNLRQGVMLPFYGNDSISVALFKGFGIMALCLVLFTLLLILQYRMNRIRSAHESLYRLYDAVISNFSTGFILLDSSLAVQYINPAGMQMLQKEPGVSYARLVFEDLVKPTLIPVSERLRAAMDGGESFSREFRVFLPDGIRSFRCDFVSLTVGNLGLFYIISLEDRTMESDIREKLSRQLEETHRYAVSKDNFFANMSHEIRTPINAILGMTYFLRNAEKDERCLEYVRKIENASEILLGVVNDILDFSKMQEHKFSLKKENFNLPEIRKILADLFNIKAEQKGVTLSIEFDCPDPFMVYGDQFRLTQVLMNLVSNAIKFTERGFVSVAVNHETIGDDIILRCTVRDTGCGISEENTTKLFTEFEQFGNVLLKKAEGTGLGLAISKRLVELMHGVIWVDSEEGKGSSFHFAVVLKKPLGAEEREAGAVAERAPPSGDDRGNGLPAVVRRTGRVLLVEDNEINAEIADALLTEIGLTVDHAADGVLAVDACRAHGPDWYDLILMDIHMPRMNGYDAARVLKAERLAACPILAVTATSEDSGMLEQHRDVIAGYIQKPYNPDVFRALFPGAEG